MNHEICICQDFLDDGLRGQIRAAATKVGYTPYFFTYAQEQDAIARLPSCEVLFTQNIKVAKANTPRLNWMCTSSAGVDQYCKPDFFKNPKCQLTNSNVYGVTLSEYTVMTLLMLLRRMPEYRKIVDARRWDAQLPIRSIFGSEICILGTGEVGTLIAERMKNMGAAKIIGISRSGRARSDIYDEMYPISRLDELLPHIHILIMVLPSTAETINILSRERIARLPSDAYVINIGRGNAIDQDAMIEALNHGMIAGAALDVTVPEPLPADHPLWDVDRLILTPHIAGNTTLAYTREAIVNCFCEDLENYAAGKPLRRLVNRNLGY